jgi:hypothetical protein
MRFTLRDSRFLKNLRYYLPPPCEKTPSMCGLNTTPGVVVVVVVVVVAALGRCCWLRVVVAGSPVCRSTYTVRSDKHKRLECTDFIQRIHVYIMVTVNTADRTGNVVRRNRFWRGRIVL